MLRTAPLAAAAVAAVGAAFTPAPAAVEVDLPALVSRAEEAVFHDRRATAPPPGVRLTTHQATVRDAVVHARPWAVVLVANVHEVHGTLPAGADAGVPEQTLSRTRMSFTFERDAAGEWVVRRHRRLGKA